MKITKLSLALALSGLLVACGGGGSDGYYNNSTGGNTTTPPESEDLDTTLDPQLILNTLKTQAPSIFGQNNPAQRGYIDHALDAYAQSILKISQDIRSIDFTKHKDNYLDKCFSESKVDYRGCYVFKGNEINNLLGDKYSKWDFVIDNGIEEENDAGLPSDDLKNIRLKSEDITPALESYYGKTYLFVFENENDEKHLQDIAIAGAFSYPFTINNKEQRRFILINNETSDFKITATKSGQTTSTEMGALSIYKVPNIAGEYFVTEAGSGFSTLVNDNLNVAFAEPVTFRIDSALGIAPSIYQVKDGIEILDLPSVTISGTRVEHEIPSLNDEEFVGSIYMKGPNLLDFSKSVTGSKLEFKHVLNEIVYEGTSTNNDGTVQTQLTSPSNVKY